VEKILSVVATTPTNKLVGAIYVAQKLQFDVEHGTG
jgi:hypothetical protein